MTPEEIDQRIEELFGVRPDEPRPAPLPREPFVPAGQVLVERVAARPGGIAKTALALHLQTDLGNAERLVSLFGDRIRYSHERRCWLVWNGSVWRHDTAGDVVELCKLAAKSIYIEASKASDEDAAALASWATKSQSQQHLTAMNALAKSMEAVRVSVADLDRDRALLNTPSGTLDLRTGVLRSQRRRDLITKSTGVAFDPRATCPTWHAFLARVMGDDPEMIAYLRRAVGYAATGESIEQVAFFLHGTGSNGKSTFLETVNRVLGEYATATRAATIMDRGPDRGGPEPEIVALVGARYVNVTEFKEDGRLDEGRLKALTGGDTIVARTLHAEPFEFEPEFKLFLGTNHKPLIRGTDNGIWRRVNLIPFEVQIPDDERDMRLPEKLAAELPGILAWIVAGAVEWYASGLQAPRKVLAATADYRSAMDALAAFLADEAVITPRAEAPAEALYRAYVAWSEKTGERVMGQRALALRLGERGFKSEHRRTGNVWVGIGVRLPVDGPVVPPAPAVPAAA
jgi:putative DNA primase/helicase